MAKKHIYLTNRKVSSAYSGNIVKKYSLKILLIILLIQEQKCFYILPYVGSCGFSNSLFGLDMNIYSFKRGVQFALCYSFCTLGLNTLYTFFSCRVVKCGTQ